MKPKHTCSTAALLINFPDRESVQIIKKHTVSRENLLLEEGNNKKKSLNPNRKDYWTIEAISVRRVNSRAISNPDEWCSNVEGV